VGENGGRAMSHPSNVPEFGQQAEGQMYAARPGAYAVIFDAQDHIAVLETPRGCFLPGGGTEGDESPEETLLREVKEECGFEVGIMGRAGEAVEYVYTAGNEFGIRKECAFFGAMFGRECGAATEADHRLIWLAPREAQKRLAHDSQRWAVRQNFETGEASTNGKATSREDGQI